MTAVVLLAAASADAQAPLCSPASYDVTRYETPCPFRDDPTNTGCLLKAGFYCGNDQIRYPEMCFYEFCAPGCNDCGGTSACSDPRVGSKEICGDGRDNNWDGCADEGCTLGKPPCTCTKSCKTPACYPVPEATCSPLKPKVKEVCADGEDNNCNGKVDENCLPDDGGEGGGGDGEGGGGGGGGGCDGSACPPPPPPPDEKCCGCKGGADPILLASRSAVTIPFTDFSATAVSTLGVSRTWNSLDTSYFGGPTGILSRLALTDRAWLGESDREIGVIGVGEIGRIGVAGLVRPN